MKTVMPFCWVIVISAGALGCGESERQEEAAPPEFEVSRPIAREIVDYADFIGRLDAIDSVQIKARVSGYLDSIQFKDGDEVKEGQTLFQIDPRPYRAQVDQDKADLANKQAVLVQKRQIYDRGTRLMAKNSIAIEDYQNQKADFDVARATVVQAEAKLKVSQLNLDWTKVTAPISGRLSQRLITRGNLVTADMTLLTTIVSVDPVYLYFTVDERTLLRLRALNSPSTSGGDEEAAGVATVAMGLANETGYSHKGKLNFEDNKVDPGTGTIQMRAEFANPKRTGGARLLSPGLFARVRLTVSTPRPGLLVADRALGTDQGKKFLYVIADQTDEKTGAQVKAVERRYVQIGDLHGGLREIKSKSDGKALPAKQTISATDLVIVSGLQRLRPGTVVTPKIIDMPNGKATAKTPNKRGK